MEPHQERQIVEGLRAGDVASWNALYDAHCESVWRLVARRLGGAADAVADVVQESFLEAARSARNFDDSLGRLSDWLHGIAHRQAMLHLRKRDRQSRDTQLDEGQRRQVVTIVRYLDGAHETPLDQALAKETATWVRRTLTDMPDDYAGLLAGKYMDGQPIRTLAERMGLSEEAARSKLARARRAFRKRLAAFMEESPSRPGQRIPAKDKE